MNFTEMALKMWPYWALGAAMVFATVKAGYGNLVRIQPKSVVKFLIFMAFVTAFRYISRVGIKDTSYVSGAMNEIMQIPTASTLTVFWEDACYGLPLVLLAMALGESKWVKPINWLAMLFVMLSFGSGHIYQGYLASAFLMFYIPYSVKAGKEHGFGTVMLCHTLYDLITILTLKHIAGVF